MTSRGMAISLWIVGLILLAGAPAWAEEDGGQSCPVSGKMGGAAMPQGHPSVSEMPVVPITASLVIQAVQSTKDGPAVGADEVTVEIYASRKVIDTVKAKLDDHGTATIKNIQAITSAQPLITIRHAGVSYQEVGQPFTPETADQKIEVPVYESTDQAPAWNVKVRHVMVHPAADGLHVSDMTVIENPTDRSWRSSSADPAEAVTVVMLLPAGAKDVQLGRGFQSSCVRIKDGRVLNSMPLLPGAWQFRMEYLVPVKDGKATLELNGAAVIHQMVVFLPDDSSTVAADGLEGGQAMAMGPQQRVRMYQARELAVGKKATLMISGLAAATKAEESMETPEAPVASSTTPKILAAGGVTVILIAAAVLLLVSPARKQRAKTGGGNG